MLSSTTSGAHLTADVYIGLKAAFAVTNAGGAAGVAFAGVSLVSLLDAELQPARNSAATIALPANRFNTMFIKILHVQTLLLV
jgi:hypothetical protein